MDDTNSESDSPYAHILHTNHAPSESEKQEIGTYILEHETRLLRLEAEIARMRSIMEGLESEHIRLKQFIDSHKALLSPIRRMAPELMQEIFIRCLPTSWNCVMDAAEAPLLLTRVCSDWRQVTLSTPELWSSLHIAIPQRPGRELINDSMSCVLHKARRWLARSGTCLLSVSLYLAESYEKDFPPIYEVLAPFMGRFQSMEFRVPSEFIPHIGSQNLPMLKELALGLTVRNPDSQFKVFSILKQTPCLRRVTIGEQLDIGEAFLLPLSQLQELHLECFCYPYQILDLLAQCSHLRIFSLSTPFFTPSTDPENRLITLPQLRILTIQARCTIFQGLLPNLVVPRLHRLKVGMLFSWGGSINIFYPMLSELIARSSCSLESFDCPHIIDFSDELVDCLVLMPGLIDLNLDSLDFKSLESWNMPVGPGEQALGVPILKLLTPAADTSSTCLLPNLQKITMLNYADLSNEILINFAHSRMRAVPLGIAPLTRIHVDRREPTDANQTLSDFVDLREDGLNIIVDSLPAREVSSVACINPWAGLFHR